MDMTRCWDHGIPATQLLPLLLCLLFHTPGGAGNVDTADASSSFLLLLGFSSDHMQFQQLSSDTEESGKPISHLPYQSFVVGRFKGTFVQGVYPFNHARGGCAT